MRLPANLRNKKTLLPLTSARNCLIVKCLLNPEYGVTNQNIVLSYIQI